MAGESTYRYTVREALLEVKRTINTRGLYIILLLSHATAASIPGPTGYLEHQRQCDSPGYEVRNGLCLPCLTGFYKATSVPSELCQPCSTRSSVRYATVVCPCISTRNTLFGCTNDNYTISGALMVCRKQAVVKEECPNEHSQTTNALSLASRSSSAPPDFALTAAAEPPKNATAVFATPSVTEVTAAATPKTLEATVGVNGFYSVEKLICIVLVGAVGLVLLSVGLTLLASYYRRSPTLTANHRHGQHRKRRVDPSGNSEMLPLRNNSSNEAPDSPWMHFIDLNTDVSETASSAESYTDVVSDDSYNSTQQDDVQVLGETEMSRLSPPHSSDQNRPQHIANGGQSLPDQYGSSHDIILRISSEMPANGVDSVLPNY